MNIDQKYLAKLLGMLGSTHDGEALNAARIADRLVHKAGLTWENILFAGRNEDFLNDLARTSYEAGKADAIPLTYATFSKYILDHTLLRTILTPWETEYLTSWVTKSFTPSEKQLTIFTRISVKTGLPLPEPSAQVKTKKDPLKDDFHDI